MSSIGVQLRQRNTYKSLDEIEDRGVTVRPSSTIIFGVDSSDRYASLQDKSNGTSSPYSFNIQKGEALLNGFFTRIALAELVFPYYIPNINIKTDYIILNDNGTIAPLLMFPVTGFYTPQEMAGVMEAQLQAATGNVALTVTYVGGRFYFNTNTVDTIAFDRGSFASPGAKIGEFQLFDLLNFGPQNKIPSTTQVSGVTRCRYTEYIDIVCSQLTYNQDLKDGSSDPVVRDMIARIYLEDEDDKVIPVWNTNTNEVIMPTDYQIPGTYPFTIHRQFRNPKMIKWERTQPLGNLTFEVYDDKGVILSPLQGVLQADNTMPDWRMTLLISEN